MKKKFITITVILLAVLVFTILFVPRTTRVEAKFENDSAQILQVDVKSHDFLLWEDKGDGKVLLTANGELRSYTVSSPIRDNSWMTQETGDEYPQEVSLYRVNEGDAVSAELYFDKKANCFVLHEQGEVYRFAIEMADSATKEMVERLITE